MLRIMGSKRQFCDGVTRREMLQVGGTGLMGLGLSDLLASGSVAAPSVVGSTADLARRELPDAETEVVSGPAAGGARLTNGELDALVVPAAAARDLRDIAVGALRVLGEPLASRPISLGVAPGEEGGALLEALDRALEEMQRSGELAALDESYGLGADL